MLQIVTGRLMGIHSGGWDVLQELDFQTMGNLVAGLFAASRLASLAMWRFGGLENALRS